MKILLIGYGKMGKTIERIATSRGHEIVGRVDEDTPLTAEMAQSADIAIEFTRPEAATSNITWCIENGLPVVSGTTGWLENKPAIDQFCRQKDGSFLHASNFSIGVHLFLKATEQLTRLMNGHQDYKASIIEVHHTAKLDMPSGTALITKDAMAKADEAYRNWHLTNHGAGAGLPITSIRQEDVPGTHTVRFENAIDSIELTHTANSREGFATGAVVAAEWLLTHPGVWGMEDVLAL